MDPRVAEIIGEAETRIAALATEATTQRNYARASALLALAQRVADAARSLGFVSSTQVEAAPVFEDSQELDAVPPNGLQFLTADVPVAQPPAIRGETHSRKTAGSSYPRFKREGETLVKIGWSKSDRATYEHRSPRDVVARLVAAIKRVAVQDERFTTEDIMPLHDDQGAELPSYQSYLCLAWLVVAGVLDKHGRQGYTVSAGADLDAAVESAWQQLPRR
jgi:hypothetical protein